MLKYQAETNKPTYRRIDRRKNIDDQCKKVHIQFPGKQIKHLMSNKSFIFKNNKS